MNTPIPKQGTNISVTVRAREDNLPFEAAWQLVPLGTFAKAKGGFGFPPELQGKKKGQYPFFKVSDMNLPSNRKQMVDANNWVDDEDLVALKAKTFPPGALIFPKIGATILTNKKRLLSRPSVIDNNVVAIVIESENRCEPEFLYYWFQTVDLAKLTNPGTVPSITSSRLHATIVPIPPLHEQRKITAILGMVQQAMEQQERILALVAELKKALLHQLFTHGLRSEPQKQTVLGPIPQSWRVVPLGGLMGEDPKNGLYKHSSHYGTGTLILRINDFSNDGNIVVGASNRAQIDEEEQKTYCLRKDDIVVNRVNSLSHLGKTAVIGELSELMVFESNMMRFRADASKALPHFLLRWMNSPVYKAQVIGSAKRAVAQSSINQGNLKAINLPLPSLEEQAEIIFYFDQIEAKLSLHRRKRAALSALFRTLLHQLMTAQVRLNDFDLRELEM